MSRLIAVAGGIGSGKSVVCHILSAMGRDVYDCDSRAKNLMDNSREIKERIARDIDAASIMPDGTIDRNRLADVVFADKRLLDRLNGIVHSAVADDIRQWAKDNSDRPMLFVETALLYQSGLDRMVDEVWEVTAPHETRVDRVVRRNNSDREHVEARIAAQDSFVPECRHGSVYEIVNDGQTPLLPQIEKLLEG